MPYTILNQSIFQAAYAGAFSGMNGDGLGSGTAPALAAGYSVTANIALAFAQSYDTNRGAAAATAFEAANTQMLSNVAWQNRNPTNVPSATVAATWTGLSADILAAVTEATSVGGGGVVPAATGLRAWVTAAATTNGQGHGASLTAVAMLQLVCSASGIFRFNASAEQPACAATEVATWTVTTQTGAGAVATTGTTPVVAANGSAPANGKALFNSAGAGTNIAITTGGGVGETSIWSSAETLGTAQVGSKFATGGLIYNAGAPFTIGQNVILLVKITNSATDRVVQSINASLEELTS